MLMEIAWAHTTIFAEMSKRTLPTEKRALSRDYRLIWGIPDQELQSCESLKCLNISALGLNEKEMRKKREPKGIIPHNL